MGDIHHAAYDGDPERVLGLLRDGVDANDRDESGYAPLHRAVFKGRRGGDREGVVRAPLRAGADVDAATDPGDSVLVIACRGGPPSLVRSIVEAGADVNDRSGRETPLTAATRAGDEGSVRLLLTRGADPAAAGPFGMTAEEWAESGGFKRAIDALRAAAPPPPSTGPG